jgi:hypothetical protein
VEDTSFSSPKGKRRQLDVASQLLAIPVGFPPQPGSHEKGGCRVIKATCLDNPEIVSGGAYLNH